MTKFSVLLLCTLLLATPAWALDQEAELFVKLALELGQYDADYVDAYLGPEEWAEAARDNPRSLEELASDSAELLAQVKSWQLTDPKLNRRQDALAKNLRAMNTRIQMAMGETFTFAEEALLIYDAVLPEYSFAAFDQALAEIAALLPGEGDLAERVDAFRESLAIPEDKVDRVSREAIKECRKRTTAYIELPEAENFTLEFVNDKSWGGYNWYQGDNHSLLQINLDSSVKINGVLGLGCHEGYPGHHVWNVLVENRLLKESGWQEHMVFPLFSPSALIAEGSANYGVELAFPGDEKIRYEREVLFPMAGLNPALAVQVDKLDQLTQGLQGATVATAQLYLDGKISREEAIEQRRKYGLSSRERAERSVRFIEQYRSYVLNYSLGEELVAAYVERHADEPGARWALFEHLLTTMPSASQLVD